MTEPSLANQLAQQIRDERDAEDPRLERLALGRLTEEERVALYRDAEQDADLAAQVELFAPLSEQALARARATADPKVRRLPTALKIVPPLLVAAVALLAVLMQGPDPLPSYAAQVRAGDAVLRGPEAPTPKDGPRRMRSDSRLTLALVPSAPVEGTVEARLYVKQGDRAAAAPGRPEVDETGAARVRGPAEQLLGVGSGTISVALVVCRPGTCPQPARVFAPDLDVPSAEATLILQPTP